MAKDAASKKADREAAVAAKQTDKANGKPEKVPVRQRAEGATHGGWNAKQPPAPVDAADRLARRQFKRRAAKVIYFIRGAMPTKEDFDNATAIGPGCVFRNALKIVPGAPLENCDAVAGEVPSDYRTVFPSASSNHVVDEENRGLAAGVTQPPRSMLNTGNAPDDARPGTVDRVDPETGKPIEHASGTGSEQPGGIKPNDRYGSVGARSHNEHSSVWKSNKLD